MARFVLATFLLSSLALAQVTPLGSVGLGQQVPDPILIGGANGQLGLNGCWVPDSGPNPGLSFTVHGMPIGYNSGTQLTQEVIFLALSFGPASPPGLSILGGQFYVPLGSPSLLGGLPSVVLTMTPPSPFPPGKIALPGPPPVTSNGARIDLGVLPPGNFGVLSAQGYVFDPAISRIYTSNALNFSIP